MWSRAALCIARSSEILNIALSGSSCTALVKCVTAVSQSPARADSCPRRYARPAAQPETSAASTIRPTSLCFNAGTPFNVAARTRGQQRDRCCGPARSLARRTPFEADRGAPFAVDILDDQRLDADPDQPIAAVDDVPFGAVVGAATVAHGRDLQPLLLHDADELQRDRRRRRWPDDRRRPGHDRRRRGHL